MTPTQRKGIIADKAYRITNIKVRGSVSGGVDVGAYVKLKEDDGTDLPYFSVTSADGSVTGQQIVIRLSDTDLEPVGDSVDTDYSIKVENGTTTLVLKKSLTVNQIHDVLAAAGLQ